MKRIFLLTMLIAFAVIPASASKKAKPPTRSEMTEAWFGYDNHNNFLRLDLREDGTGSLVWLQLGGKSRSIYDIPRWDWDETKSKLALSVKGRTSQEEDLWVRVKSAGNSDIVISFGGKKLRWNREAKLFNEREALERLDAAGTTEKTEPKNVRPENVVAEWRCFYNGKTYKAVITEELLATTPKWEVRDDNPPLSAGRAIAIARGVLARQGWYTFDLGDLKKDPLLSVGLIQLQGKWLYAVSFRDLNSRFMKLFQIPVLMDGSVPTFAEMR